VNYSETCTFYKYPAVIMLVIDFCCN